MEGVGQRLAMNPIRGQWHPRGLDAWPSALPSGTAGENWWGWSSLPSAQWKWAPEQRSLVQQVVAQQYESARLDAPSSLAKLAQSEARVVTVGHQLVIAGGPAFLHHKILSAIRTARALERQWGVPVVPLFWLASEDHDWKEVSTVHGMQQGHQWIPEDAGTPWPVGRRSLNGLTEVIQAWGQDGPHQQEADSLAREVRLAQTCGESLAGVFRRWLHRWYGEDGLLVLDPDDASLKAAASHLWCNEMKGAGVAHMIGSKAQSGPAHVRDNQLFWLGDAAQGRVGLVPDAQKGGWQAGSMSVTKPEAGWEEWAVSNAAHCSPGVLLRPLYQEFLLESAAVVVGPGEWGYWSQLPEAFASSGLAMPSLRLRDHALVISERVTEMGWDLSQGWMHEEDWDRWVLDGWMAGHAQALQGWEAELGSTMAKAGEWATNLSPELKGASGAMSQSLDKAWQQWKKKARKSLKNQRHQEWAVSRAAHASLMRRGMPQDRWANWHVLAATQGGHDAWKKAWLAHSEDPAARLWILHSED